MVTIRPNNPIVFYQGWRIKLPRKYTDRQYYRTVTDDQLAYWCVEDADMVLSIPLPLVAFAGSKRYVNAYNVQGLWLQDPPATWTKKQDHAVQKFRAFAPENS